VFGERRLRALKYLGRQTVLARVLDIDALLQAEQAEHDENECRLAFTPSERAAIAKAIAEEIGNRAGQRTDLAPRCNCAEVATGQRTLELVAAMDAGAVSVSTACARPYVRRAGYLVTLPDGLCVVPRRRRGWQRCRGRKRLRLRRLELNSTGAGDAAMRPRYPRSDR
jgi:hypothetical protein